MVKKNWENPELMGLELNATKEGSDDSIEVINENGKIGYRCKYCGAFSWTSVGNILHEISCGRPVYPLPDPEEGGPIPTFS